MDHRLLFLNPTKCLSILLSDEAESWPEVGTGCELGISDSGELSAKLFQRMADWADGEGYFEENYTAREKKEALAAIEGLGLLESPAELRALLRQTVIHYENGKTKNYEADRADLLAVSASEWELSTNVVRISHAEGCARYFSLEKLCLIDIPLIEIQAAQSEIGGRA